MADHRAVDPPRSEALRCLRRLGRMLGSGQGGLVLGFLCLGLFAMGWLFGPMGALLPELFPTRVRYTGASVTYHLAGILGASAAPYLAQRLSEWGGVG